MQRNKKPALAKKKKKKEEEETGYYVCRQPMCGFDITHMRVGFDITRLIFTTIYGSYCIF